MSDICPSLVSIRPAKPADKKDDFKPDRFRILEAEKLTRVKEIVFNSTKNTLQIQVLCCYRVKDHPENYCKKHRVDHPKKRVHDDKAGIKNSYVHFHIKIENANDNGSLLAFIEGADVEDNRTALVQEMVRSIQWLEITDKPVRFNIFTFGEPLFSGPQNISHLDNCIDNAINTLKDKHALVVDHDKTHINKNSENRLTVSLRNKKLSFAAS